jgi:hypothetical protein
MSQKPVKFEVSWNKRAGIFYGPATGHPIQWNKDWNDLITKEVSLEPFSFLLVPAKVVDTSGATALMSMVQKSNGVFFNVRALAGAFARSLSHIHTHTHQSTARDNFSRKFLAGQIGAPLPVYADVSMNDANWNAMLKSTYEDLGQ